MPEREGAVPGRIGVVDVEPRKMPVLWNFLCVRPWNAIVVHVLERYGELSFYVLDQVCADWSGVVHLVLLAHDWSRTISTHHWVFFRSAYHCRASVNSREVVPFRAIPSIELDVSILRLNHRSVVRIHDAIDGGVYAHLAIFLPTHLECYHVVFALPKRCHPDERCRPQINHIHLYWVALAQTVVLVVNAHLPILHPIEGQDVRIVVRSVLPRPWSCAWVSTVVEILEPLPSFTWWSELAMRDFVVDVRQFPGWHFT